MSTNNKIDRHTAVVINEQKELWSYGSIVNFVEFDIEDGTEAEHFLEDGHFPVSGTDGVSNEKSYNVSFDFVKEVYAIAFGSKLDSKGIQVEAIDANFVERDCLSMLREMSDAFAKQQ
jgi:hypothetical protein